MQRREKRNSGITLVELMVAIGVSSFITVVVVGTLAIGGKSWITGEAMLIAQQQARVGLQNMLRELRVAEYAAVGPGKEWVKFSVPLDVDGDGFIDLIPGTELIAFGAEDPNDNNGNGDLWEIDWVIKFEVDVTNGQILRKVLEEDGVTLQYQRVIARNVNPDLSLTYFTDESGGFGGVTEEAVIVSITTQIDQLQGKYINPPITTTFKTRVNLRNGP